MANPNTIHEGIRIPFASGDGKRAYEGVGFLKAHEISIDGDEMLRRTAIENGGAIKDDDWEYLGEYGFQPNPEIEKYILVTDRREPNDLLEVSYFYHHGTFWCEYWHSLDSQWYEGVLVVRRLL